MGHGLIRELVKQWREKIHRSICDEKRTPGPGCRRREVFVVFRVQVKLVLYESRQMGAEYACLVCRLSRSVVADRRILTESHAYTNNLPKSELDTGQEAMFHTF